MPKSDGSVIISTKVDTKGMQGGINDMSGMASKLGSTFKKLGGIIAATFAVRQVISFAKEAVAAAQVQEEAERKLETVMKQRMNATEESIRYIKQYAGELQQTGVVGDEVQLAGAQQVSTFLNSTKALKTLLPAMNDLAVQQNGVNVTSENMAQIGNLVGKVMQGQTSALTRVGITFSEAEEKMLKYGNEEERAAMLAKVITNNVGHMNEAIANTPAGQIQQLKNNFGDLMESIGGGLQNVFLPIIKVINVLVAKLATLASAFKAFTQLITGKSGTRPAGAGIANMADGYSDATDSAIDYAGATNDVADATKKANKENRKYLSGLDEIRKWEEDSGSDTGTTAAKGKTTAASPGTGAAVASPVDFGTLEQGDTVVDKLAGKMKNLYDTIVKGVQPTVIALKNLWDNGLQRLGQFTWQALKDFYNLFLVPVAKWTMGTGIPRFINALNDGLMAINWKTINAGLAKLWEVLAPFAVNVGEGLLWFWEHVLVPLRTWTMNEVVPRFLETLANVIGIVNIVVDAAKPGFQWFWDNVLVPIAGWTGGVFLSIWDGINTALSKFVQWCKENPGTVREIASAVAVFFAAWEFAGFVTGITSVITSFNPLVLAIMGVVAVGALIIDNWDAIKEKAAEVWEHLSTWLPEKWESIKAGAKEKFEFIKKKINNAWTAVRATGKTLWNGIATTLTDKWESIKTAAKDKFDHARKVVTDSWNTVKTNASTKWEGIKTTLKGKWETIKTNAKDKFEAAKGFVVDSWETVRTEAGSKWETIKSTVTGVWDGISAAASDVWDGISTTVTDVWDSITGTVQDAVDWVTDIFTGNWEGAWQTVVDTFENVFSGIIDVAKAPVNAIAGAVNALIDGINRAIGAIESHLVLDFEIPNPFGGTLWELHWQASLPRIPDWFRIPLLAKGAVIPPNAPFLAQLGDQRHGTNIEAPLETIKDAVREVVGGSGTGDIHLTVNLDGKVVYDTVVKRGRMQQQASGRNPFELAT